MGYFFDTALMAAPFEGSVEKLVDDLDGEVGGDETSRERKDVGVVVLASEMCNLDVPTEGATYVRIFVYSHLDSVARAADDDAAGEFTTVDGRAELVGEVGVVAGVGGEGAEVFDVEAVVFEIIDYQLFEFIAGVVASDWYNFVHWCDN